jgi:hypothetical protein
VIRDSLRALQRRAQAERALFRRLDEVVDACVRTPSHEVSLATVALGVRALAPEIVLDDEQLSMLAVEALDRLHVRQAAR